MDWIQVVILAVLQGLTEFLPVSSAAHLLLVPLVTGWEDQGLAFDVAVHLGSLIAVLTYFRREIGAMFMDWSRSVVTRRLNANARLAWAVILGTIPVGLAGLLSRDWLSETFREPAVGGVVMGLTLIGFGVLLGWADWRHRGERGEYGLNWKDVLVIGCAQALALIPGTSRSGITITAGLLMGLGREGAARFSFLLSIPVIVLAGGLQLFELLGSGEAVDWAAMALGTALAAVSAYACIHYFLAFIRRIGMQPFVAYRLVLGAVLLLLFL